MEYFNFEAEDFQILEDIEFDETIERPEAIRFYTLEEQTVDAFERLIPRGRSTKFAKDQVRKEVDALRELYSKFVVPTPTEYTVRDIKQSIHVDWVHPVYASGALQPFEWSGWLALFEDQGARGFYPRMLAGLPQPYTMTPEGTPYPVGRPTEFLDTNGDAPLRALPMYEKTKAIVHEDKTITITKVPIEGTEDQLSSMGYFLQKRPLEIPNPLPEHPFFKSNEPTFLESQAPLEDVFPTMDAILTHGVPVTKHPYKEATPFLKLYDIQLSAIPWEQWKVKFPPADVMEGERQPEPLAFPKSKKDAPSEKLVTAYKSRYDPGLASRYWLSKQIDGGEFVIQLLLSESINNGSVETVPELIPLPEQFPEASCELLGRNFQEFTTQGTIRRSWTIKKDRDGNSFDEVKYQCVPLEFVQQERRRFGYKNKQQWKEGLDERMKTEYLRYMNTVFPVVPIVKKEPALAKTPGRPESILRKEIVAVLNDPKRFPEDKLADIRELLKAGAFLTGQIYTDADTTFLLCSHTLAVLSGELMDDRFKFYETWTVLQDGFRVCRYCGEHVGLQDLVEQEDFDEGGFVVRHTEVLETGKPQQLSEELSSYTRGIQSLRNLVQLENPVDDVMFLLITLLQVLPDAEMFQLFVKTARAFADTQVSKKETGTKANELRGAIGLAGAILLLQSHLPFLVPRRSFGATPVKLNGYPRDAAVPEEFSIIDSLMSVFQKTFQAFPTAFKGASAPFIRSILNDRKPIRKLVPVIIKNILAKNPDIKTGLERAKVHVETIPQVEQPKTLIPVVAPPAELNVIRSFGKCPSARPIWSNGRIPKIVQDDVPLRSGLLGAANKDFIEPSVSVREQVADIPKPEIAARLKKTTKARVAVKDPYHTNLLAASRLYDLFEIPNPIRSVNPSQNRAELRDIGKGFLLEILDIIQKDPTKQRRLDELLSKDVALYTILGDYVQNKTNLNKLRADERMTFVQRMTQKSDDEREVIGDLLRIGLAPYVITNEDRGFLAREAERMQDELMRIEEVDEEVGVGMPRDDQNEEEFIGGADHGDYGDNQPLPEGRDYDQPSFGDDDETSI